MLVVNVNIQLPSQKKIKIPYCHYHESQITVPIVFRFTWYHWKFTICLCINYANSTDQSNESRMQLLGFEPTTYLIHVNALPNGLVCDPNTLYQTYIGWCSSVFFISPHFCNTEGRWAFITSKQWVAKTITIYLFFNWSYVLAHSSWTVCKQP